MKAAHPSLAQNEVLPPPEPDSLLATDKGLGPVQRALDAVPPPVLVLLSIISIQLGAVLAIQLFDSLGPIGTVLLRVAISALLLLAFARPALDSHLRRHLPLIILYGVLIGAMNLCFYLAIARIPLGLAVTIEFLGPLGVAVAFSRRPIDFFWVGLAALGIGLLSPSLGQDLDPLGAGFAALAGVGWGFMILVSKKVGRLFTGSSGLALGMAVAAVFLLPFGLAEGSLGALNLTLLLAAFGVALLSTTIPFFMEFEAIKRVSARTYGILVTLEPAVAVLAGVLFLGEALGWNGIFAVACVTLAAIGVTLSEKKT